MSKKIEAQNRKFMEAARELGVDKDADVDEVMRRLAGQKPQKRPSSKRSPQNKQDD